MNLRKIKFEKQKLNFLKVKEEWKYTALVIDRLFLVIFTTACFAGTISIILQAPSFYGITRKTLFYSYI